MPADWGERVNLAKQTSSGRIVLAIVFGLGAVIGQPVQAQTFTGMAYTGSIDPVAESPSGVLRSNALDCCRCDLPHL